MEWKTAVTEILGCRYPIIQGAMAGFGTWKLASAVAEAGGHGILTASISRTPEKLREDISRCRDATAKSPGSFGVNLSLNVCPRVDEMLEVCIEEGVHVETAAYKPDALAPRIKEADVTWIHKVTRVGDALHAEKQGADAVIIVGMEGVGFKNPEQLPTMINTVWAKRELTIPVIAAGGIGDARGFLGALGLGADGIMMGTAFMATKECRMKDSAKEAMVLARPDDPQIRSRTLAPPDLEAYQKVKEMRNQLAEDKWLRKVDSAYAKSAGKQVDAASSSVPSKSEQSKMVSLAAGFIDRVSTVKEFIDRMISDAEELVNGYSFLKRE